MVRVRGDLDVGRTPENHVRGRGAEAVEFERECAEEFEVDLGPIVVACRVGGRGLRVDAVGEIAVDEVERRTGVGPRPFVEVSLDGSGCMGVQIVFMHISPCISLRTSL